MSPYFKKIFKAQDKQAQMIEKTLKTKAGKIRVRIPTVISEITLGQMMAMQEKRFPDELETISLLSGVSREDLSTGTNFGDLKLFGSYIHSLSRQVKYLYDGDLITQRVVFILSGRRVVVNVARNLSIEPAEAFVAARDIIADEINEHISLYGEDDWKEHFQPSLASCCNLLAHYFFCRVTGKAYNEADANDFTKEVEKLLVTEALPIAKYFFASYPDLLHQKTNLFQRLHQYGRRKLISTRLKNLNH